MKVSTHPACKPTCQGGRTSGIFKPWICIQFVFKCGDSKGWFNLFIWTFFICLSEPRNSVNLSFIQPPTNSSFIIDYDFHANDHFDSIVFTLGSSGPTIVRKKADTPRQIEFSALDAGKFYGVSVHTISGSEESETKQIGAQTCKLKIIHKIYLHFIRYMFF